MFILFTYGRQSVSVALCLVSVDTANHTKTPDSMSANGLMIMCVTILQELSCMLEHLASTCKNDIRDQISQFQISRIRPAVLQMIRFVAVQQKNGRAVPGNCIIRGLAQIFPDPYWKNYPPKMIDPARMDDLDWFGIKSMTKCAVHLTMLFLFGQ